MHVPDLACMRGEKEVSVGHTETACRCAGPGQCHPAVLARALSLFCFMPVSPHCPFYSGALLLLLVLLLLLLDSGRLLLLVPLASWQLADQLWLALMPQVPTALSAQPWQLAAAPDSIEGKTAAAV